MPLVKAAAKLDEGDARWLAAASALAERGRPLSRPNPGVGAIIVNGGVVVGRGWTQAGGRPHAEAIALAQAGETARDAILYVTLEPCAHQSPRGPACADLVAAAGLAKVVVGMADPDLRTAGQGIARLRASGTVVELAGLDPAAMRLSGHACALEFGRPHITLKLALSLDGCIALASGVSQWITGAAARAHAHRERARADAILVGGGTLRADLPRLGVRLSGLEERSPERWVLTSGTAPEGWHHLSSPDDLTAMAHLRYVLIEGGAGAAAAFLRADLVDRLLIYRAPIIIGGGQPGVGDIGLTELADAHGRWRLADSRELGSDRLEVYQRGERGI